MLKNKTCVLGSFKTLHLGHQELVKIANQIESGFDIIRIKRESNVLLNSEIELILKELNLKNFNQIIELNFNSIKNLSALDFINYLKCNGYQNIVCGDDYKFGFKQSGDISLLKKHFNVISSSLINFKNQKISSSEIIKNINNLDNFVNLHGFNYFIYSKVLKGDQIGRKINFKTINSNCEHKLLPSFGVYYSITTFNGVKFKSVTNIGIRPTIKNKNQIRFETHILDFDQEIYDQEVKVELVEKIRNEMKFENLDQLKNQIQKDVENVRLK